MVKIEDVKNNPKVKYYITLADKCLESLGYTEHGFRHVGWVSYQAGRILRELGYPDRLAELAEIAGYLHDIGNGINRINHEVSGAMLAYDILKEMNMSYEEIGIVISAIGTHHEASGYPVSEVSAALILADKADVHRTRVRTIENLNIDIHDRVNYAAINREVIINKERKSIAYKIEIDIKIAPVLEFFEIFLDRTIMAQKAAKVLNCNFDLFINDSKLL
ncbi:MAG: HD domain-containing protein [candidate division WOR-3 bacterium]